MSNAVVTDHQIDRGRTETDAELFEAELDLRLSNLIYTFAKARLAVAFIFLIYYITVIKNIQSSLLITYMVSIITANMVKNIIQLYTCQYKLVQCDHIFETSAIIFSVVMSFIYLSNLEVFEPLFWVLLSYSLYNFSIYMFYLYLSYVIESDLNLEFDTIDPESQSQSQDSTQPTESDMDFAGYTLTYNNNYVIQLADYPQDYMIEGDTIIFKDKTAYCPITMENYKQGDRVMILVCGHHFLEQAMMDWLRRNDSCPLCRMRLR